MYTEHKDGSAVYRCDVCGRHGFWKSAGFTWERYGAMEGDGIDTCSSECRAAIPDPANAFLRLFSGSQHADGFWWDRKHDGLIGDEPPNPRHDDIEHAPTFSEGKTIGCPKCAAPMPVQLGASRCPACKASVEVTSETTYCAVVVPKQPKRRRIPSGL